MRSRNNKRGKLVIMIIILLAMPLIAQPSHAQESKANAIATRDWWDPSWRFKQSILVTNNLNVSQISVPVFVYINVEQGSVLSAINDVRVVSRGSEIPSYILYQNVEGGFVIGVSLSFMLNLAPRERRVIEIYYGNPRAAMPAYRVEGTISQRQTTTTLEFDVPSQRFLIRFGGQYHHSLSFMVREAKGAFSSTDLNATRFELIQGWQSLGNLTRYSLGAGKAVLRGGSLVLVVTGVWNEKSIWLASSIINTGSSGTGLTSLTSLFDFSQFGRLGLAEGRYDTNTDTFQLGVAGSWFVVASSLAPRAFDVVSISKAYEAIRTRDFLERKESTNDVAFVSRMNIGFLSPSEHMEQSWVWSISDSIPSALSSSLNMRDGISVVTVSQELPDTPMPLATMRYLSSIELTNLSLPSAGFAMNIDTKGSIALPGSTVLEGEISYKVPNDLESGFEAVTDFWLVDSASRSGRVYGSPNHLIAERGRVGRLWASVDEDAKRGSANASLISRPLALDGIEQAKMNFTYLASHSKDANGTAYVALRIDYNRDGLADKNLLLPILDLTYSTSIKPATIPEYLVANKTWNRMTIDLANEIPIDGSTVWFEVRVKVRHGNVELNVDDIRLELVGDASKVTVVSSTQSELGAELKITRTREHIANNAAANLRVEFQVATVKEFSGGPDARFSVDYGTPELELLKASQRVGDARIASEPHSFIVFTSRPLSIASIKINEHLIDLNRAVRLSGLAMVDQDQLEGSGSHMIVLEYAFGRLIVHARNVADRDASGVAVQVKDAFGITIDKRETAGDGLTVFHLPPSVYNVELYYHNQRLGSRTVVVQSDVRFSAEVPLYQMGFRTIDRLGDTLGDSKVTLLIGNVSVAEGRPSNDGIVRLGMIGQREYVIVVEHQGIVAYDSSIRANIDGATVILNTGIVPFWFTVIIISILGALAASILFYAKKRWL